jgi:hypothetical protein
MAKETDDIMRAHALQVTEAEAAVLMLSRKRARLLSQARELADERVSVTFQAQAFEPGARHRLREINQELALLDAELRNTDAALSEAGQRLAIAQHTEKVA